MRRMTVRAFVPFAPFALSAVLLLGACASRPTPRPSLTPPNVSARIDPVQLPLVELPAAVIPMSEVALPAARQRLLDLVDSLTQQPAFRMAHWGVLIMDPEVSDTLVSINAEKLFMPASNQKLVTGATALEILGPEYVWRTPVLLRGRISNGTFRGDVVLVGRGDPSWSDALQSGSALDALVPIADALSARGVRRVAGRLIADGDAFSDAAPGFGWGWDDLDFAYSAGVDELMLNENFFRVIVTSGALVDAPASVRLEPAINYPQLRAQVRTRARGDSIAARRAPLTAGTDSSTVLLEVGGTIALGDSTVLTRAYRHPNSAVIAALRTVLVGRGIRLSAAPAPADDAPTDTLVVLRSAQLRDVITRMQKPSQNQLAEALFKTMALEQTGAGTADSARAVVERQLAEWGIGEADAAVRDGSGLSRHDYLSPRAVVRLLIVMQSHPHFADFYRALPVAGVDGTIASRMRGTPAEGNLRAKTGFVDKARSLSGYVNTSDGHQLVFSILANNWIGSVRDVEQVQDAIGAYLASVRMQDLRVAMPR